MSWVGNLEEIASEWKPEKAKGANLERKSKGIIKQRKDELLNRQKPCPCEVREHHWTGRKPDLGSRPVVGTDPNTSS